MQDSVANLPDYTTRRDTARAIIYKDGCILVIDRVRPDARYYSTPGGGIEPGETAASAVIREVFEETSLRVELGREVYIWKEGEHEHHFFVCTYISGSPKLHNLAEENYDLPGSSHTPMWVPIATIGPGTFGYWEPIREKILQGVIYGFPASVVYLT